MGFLSSVFGGAKSVAASKPVSRAAIKVQPRGKTTSYVNVRRDGRIRDIEIDEDNNVFVKRTTDVGGSKYNYVGSAPGQHTALRYERDKFGKVSAVKPSRITGESHEQGFASSLARGGQQLHKVVGKNKYAEVSPGVALGNQRDIWGIATPDGTRRAKAPYLGSEMSKVRPARLAAAEDRRALMRSSSQPAPALPSPQQQASFSYTPVNLSQLSAFTKVTSAPKNPSSNQFSAFVPKPTGSPNTGGGSLGSHPFQSIPSGTTGNNPYKVVAPPSKKKQSPPPPPPPPPTPLPPPVDLGGTDQSADTGKVKKVNPRRDAWHASLKEFRKSKGLPDEPITGSQKENEAKAEHAGWSFKYKSGKA